MKIGVFRTTDPMYGGVRYEEMAMRALEARHEVVSFDATPWLRRGQRVQSFLRVQLAERNRDIDLWLRGETAVVGMGLRKSRAKNVALVHHLDATMGSWGWWNRSLERRWVSQARRCDCVVAVADFWRNRLSGLDFPRLELIYNAFDTNRFEIAPDAIEEFRKRHGLTGKPLIYIGNCQRRKGAARVWEALKDEGYHLVTSGLSDLDLPVRRFTLPYADYITLLASADVAITMSEFLEGWNRTAHEALLAGTPVVGSGAGGMGELLSRSGQIICRDVSDLRSAVHDALERQEALGAEGRRFASQFTKERFNEQWLQLIDSLAPNGGVQ